MVRRVNKRSRSSITYFEEMGNDPCCVQGTTLEWMGNEAFCEEPYTALLGIRFTCLKWVCFHGSWWPTFLHGQNLCATALDGRVGQGQWLTSLRGTPLLYEEGTP